MVCCTCGCWKQSTEDKTCGYCVLFENIETHEKDICKLEEDEDEH